MFGTIMRARVKPGHRDEVEKRFNEISEKYEDEGRGLVSVELAFEDKDPDRVVTVVHFTDRETYFKNADDPRTNADWELLSQHLDGPPEWIDVAYKTRFGAGVTAGR
jgi:quinol monooxygenase YgiN